MCSMLLQGHAGTIPMRLRHDPLAAAAEAMGSLEQRCNGGYLSGQAADGVPADARSDGSLVCTVGQLTLWPGASNVIPGAANFTVDIRSARAAVQE